MAAVPLLRPGENCQRVARAGRAALLIDADAYFNAFARAALRAHRSIVIVGWDFHSGTRLHLGKRDVPDVLGDFLNFLVRRRRTLKVYVLTWEYPLVFARGRESAPVYKLGWHPHRRVNFRYDDRCPIGSALHQKVVVIDGAMGFCGGIDLTRGRWDTSEHRACDPRRRDEGDPAPYPPFHDAMLAVDGDAARALHDLASERWSNATGQSLPPPEVAADPWPLELPPTFANVDVGIARTMPPFDGQSPVAEIRNLYLDLIASAKRYIYIENQYFTAQELGEALAARLMEPTGPEVIVVLRHSAAGLVEAPAMRTMRTVLLRRLRAADRHGRFHAYYPCLPGLPPDQCCDLHSKLMIVDDEWLRVGSANFANRSMGLDTECDLLIEARGEPRTLRAIAASRNRLLAEHLDVPEGAVCEAIASHVSLAAAIDSLGSAFGQQSRRALEPFQDLSEPSPPLVAIATIVDPELPEPLETDPADLSVPIPSVAGESRVPVLVGVAVLAAGLTLLWHTEVLAPLMDALRAMELARSVAGTAWIVALILVAYTPAALVLFPRPVITIFAVVALGPLLGFASSFAGMMLAAAATYWVGLRLDRSFVRRLAGRRLGRVSRFLYHRGTLALAAVRLVPLAPFAVVNVVAAAMGVGARRFLVGTALGLLPGTLVATLFGDELAEWARDPHSINIALCAAAVAALVTSGWAVNHWFAASREGPGYFVGGKRNTSLPGGLAMHSSAPQTGRTNDRCAAAAE